MSSGKELVLPNLFKLWWHGHRYYSADCTGDPCAKRLLQGPECESAWSYFLLSLPVFPSTLLPVEKKMSKKAQIHLFLSFFLLKSKLAPLKQCQGKVSLEVCYGRHNSPDGDVAASHKGQQSSRWEVLLASNQHTTIPHGIWVQVLCRTKSFR